MAGSGVKGIAVIQVGGLHGVGISLDTFFLLSRKRVMEQVRIKSSEGALCGMMLFLSCYFRLRKRNWTVHLWD